MKTHPYNQMCLRGVWRSFYPQLFPFFCFPPPFLPLLPFFPLPFFPSPLRSLGSFFPFCPFLPLFCFPFFSAGFAPSSSYSTSQRSSSPHVSSCLPGNTSSLARQAVPVLHCQCLAVALVHLTGSTMIAYLELCPYHPSSSSRKSVPV